MNVKGKSTRQLLNLDTDEFLRLGRADLAKVVSRLASTGNKRIKELESRGYSTPATRKASKRGGGSFSTKGKNLNQLRAEYVRAKQFLQNETSTVKGYQKFTETSVAKLREIGTDVSPENYNRFTKVYDRLQEKDPIYANRQFRYKAMREVARMVEQDKSDLAIVRRMNKYVRELYEKEEQEDISNFFGLP